MLHTFVVHVEDQPGVLTRVTSVFRRRCLSIDSLAVGRTERPEVSRMTIVADMEADQACRIEANLCKLLNVLRVEDVTNEAALIRGMVLIKVAATHESRPHILDLAHVFRGRVVDISADSLTIEVTGCRDKIDALVQVLRPIGILEMARAGNVAMRRGNKTSAIVPLTVPTHVPYSC